MCIGKQYVFFSNKCSMRALFILFSLSGFWDQRKFLLFQDIKETRHDIYHKVQMTKIEQNAICSQHLHCMHECENSCSSCEQYFFLLRVVWGLQENWVKSEIAFVVAQTCHYYCMLFFSWKNPKLHILRENQFKNFCYNTKKPENTYCWI